MEKHRAQAQSFDCWAAVCCCHLVCVAALAGIIPCSAARVKMHYG